MVKFKSYLKKYNSFLEINSFVKAQILKYNLSVLNRKYSRKKLKIKNYEYSQENVFKLLKYNLRSRRLNLSSNFKKKPNILFVGTNLHQDHSGIIQSLKKIGNVELIYKLNGEYGFHSINIDKSKNLYDIHTVKTNSKIILEKVIKLVNENKIDILIGQMWANYISLETLRKIRNMGIIVINIAMDDMLPEHWKSKNGVKLGSIGLASETDLILNTTKGKCEWYYIDGYPSIFFPLASNLNTFSHVKNSARDIDVSFVGSKYGIRGKLVQFLLKNGIKVQAYGNFWKNGAISAEKTAEIFHRSKIILGCGVVGHTHDVYTIKLRDFDAPISGAMYLTHKNQDLTDLYEEGKEIVFYENSHECLEKIKYYLNNDLLREKIALEGRRRASKDHTWDLRFKKVFSIINKLS